MSTFSVLNMAQGKTSWLATTMSCQQDFHHKQLLVLPSSASHVVSRPLLPLLAFHVNGPSKFRTCGHKNHFAITKQITSHSDDGYIPHKYIIHKFIAVKSTWPTYEHTHIFIYVCTYTKTDSFLNDFAHIIHLFMCNTLYIYICRTEPGSRGDRHLILL